MKILLTALTLAVLTGCASTGGRDGDVETALTVIPNLIPQGSSTIVIVCKTWSECNTTTDITITSGEFEDATSTAMPRKKY